MTPKKPKPVKRPKPPKPQIDQPIRIPARPGTPKKP